MNQLERFFALKAHGTSVRTEALAGVTTFLTMLYIVVVNPLILGDAGEEDAAQCRLPRHAHAQHHGVGEVGVQPHAWRERQGVVG